MGHQEHWGTLAKRAIAGLTILLGVSALTDVYGLPSFRARPTFAASCQAIVSKEARLTKQQLAQLLTISEGDNRDRIRAIVKEPYCQLQTLQIRAGTPAQREAYPLEFEPDTWLVILYEGEQYTGYRFAVQ